jgi:hypothetical protein
LTVEGSPEEIGEQVAILAVKPGKRVLKYPEDVLAGFLKQGMGGLFSKGMSKVTWDYFVKTANTMARTFPDDYKTELETMVKTGDFDRNLALVGNRSSAAISIFPPPGTSTSTVSSPSIGPRESTRSFRSVFRDWWAV